MKFIFPRSLVCTARARFALALPGLSGATFSVSMFRYAVEENTSSIINQKRSHPTNNLILNKRHLSLLTCQI